MQNIKYCPKCNQASADSNISFCPFDGTALVEMQPVQNQREQQQFKSQQSSATTQIQKVVEQGSSQQGSLQLSSIVSSTTQWFSGLSNKGKFITIVSIITLLLIGAILPEIDKRNKVSTPPIASNDSSQTPIASTSSTLLSPLPSSLSSTENLELGKKALSDGDLSTARSHLSAISKEAKELASAKQYLATVERREKRKVVEDELENVKRDEVGAEDMLNRTKNMEGSIGKNIYANALKRKAELQLQRIKLERQLKSMP